jgi:DNA-binding NarL/FixJ family response regulator
VVVVEDSEAFLMRLRLALRDVPQLSVVGIAESAEPAIRLLEQTEPDLVLLDLFLKEGSGMDVLRYIHKSGLKVRTIVMTSEQSDELSSACRSLGAYRFLDKAELILALPDEVSALSRALSGANPRLVYGESAKAGE